MDSQKVSPNVIASLRPVERKKRGPGKLYLLEYSPYYGKHNIVCTSPFRSNRMTPPP